ncbi:calsyntenin 1 [Dermatophagoides farinae]|uniref:calsyntenin 1 n=1 Tax=Dermatophagoides farinae TaxID=6954 RepID=UPI003F62C969
MKSYHHIHRDDYSHHHHHHHHGGRNWLMITKCLAIISLIFVESSLAFNKVPRFDLTKPEDGFHAIVKENDRTVIISPRIKVVDAELCNIEIVNKHHNDIPFEVQITDQLNGEAIITAKRDLNCEKKRSYHFTMRAVSCTGQYSANTTVHVTVEDVNEFAPVFRQDSYVVTVNEGRIIDPIIQVEAIDHDCSLKYSEICKYEIIGGDKLNTPFSIDSNGNIKNTRALYYKESHNHILEIVAYDCGMKRSKPAIVNIKINKVCTLGWKGIPERMEYIPGSGSRVLVPDAELQLCDFPCETENVTVRMSLATHHIGKGCDRDTYSVESQRKLCGANVESIDLLPSPTTGSEWIRDLPTDEGRESDQIYEFDGTNNAVIVPENVFDHNLTSKFTISFWMKHEPPLDQSNKHIKEHIICNADDHKKNRHHYSLFVRNCRLILLLRREYNEEKHTVFKPAEYRWKLAQVCDNEWHHFAVSMDFPDATLFVDGIRFHNTSSNPEIVDDWPLHAVKDVKTTFSVGACWEGKKSKMNFYFRGFLAGLTLLRGQTDNPDIFKCLHHCKEGLRQPSSDSIDSGIDILSSGDSTSIMVTGKESIDVEDVVSQISYINSREYPTPGRRSLKLSTWVTCSNGKKLKVPQVDTYVMVMPADPPTILINGTPNLAREYESFMQGIELFSSVSIYINQENENDNNESDNDIEDNNDEDEMNNVPPSIAKLIGEHKLDSCSIKVYPPLNPDHEYFRLPNQMMQHLSIRYKEAKDGIIIYGADSVHNYNQIIRQLIYFNRKPAYYLNRAFKLTCSELNRRFSSNDYIQTLTVIHPKIEPIESRPQASGIGVQKFVAHSQTSEHKVELKEPLIKSTARFFDNSITVDPNDSFVRATPSHAVTIIIVVCVGFLVFMIVLGVIRIRSAHHRNNDSTTEDQEMAWDDNSLNITVNPLDQIEQEHENPQLNDDDDDSDSSDDASSYREDCETSEEEVDKTNKGRSELEWDDANF